MHKGYSTSVWSIVSGSPAKQTIYRLKPSKSWCQWWASKWNVLYLWIRMGHRIHRTGTPLEKELNKFTEHAFGFYKASHIYYSTGTRVMQCTLNFNYCYTFMCTWMFKKMNDNSYSILSCFQYYQNNIVSSHLIVFW